MDLQVHPRRGLKTPPYVCRLWRTYQTGLHDLCGKDTPWEELSARIIANLVKVCRRYEGERVAVVFGAAHCQRILDALSAVEGGRASPATRQWARQLPEGATANPVP